MTTDQKAEPILKEQRFEYCVDGCSGNTPTIHERSLYAGYWIVRCSCCFKVRRINTMLGLPADFDGDHVVMVKSGKPYYKQKNQVGAAQERKRLLAVLKANGTTPNIGDIIDVKWVRQVLELPYSKGIAPYAIVKRMLARGDIEQAEVKGRYRWVKSLA